MSGQLRYRIYIATWAGDYPLGRRLARMQTRPENTPLQRLEGHVNLAHLLVAHGRWAEAAEELDRAAELDPERARLQRAVLATLPFLAVPDGDLLEALEELERWSPETAGPDATPATGYDSHVRLYFLGLLSSKLGDFDEALSRADAVEALANPAGTAVPGELATSVRADVAWRRGDAPEARARCSRRQSVQAGECMPVCRHGPRIRQADGIAGRPEADRIGDPFRSTRARWLDSVSTATDPSRVRRHGRARRP